MHGCASTGGFTDCLLQNGAGRVYTIDAGYGQPAWKLRNDSRVVVIERTNIRHMPKEAVPETVHLATVDVSFISLKIVVPVMLEFLDENAAIIALVKPQFEVGRENVGKGGVVKDPALHEEVLRTLGDFFENAGLKCGPEIPSPILGSKGNREFLMIGQKKNGEPAKFVTRICRKSEIRSEAMAGGNTVFKVENRYRRPRSRGSFPQRRTPQAPVKPKRRAVPSFDDKPACFLTGP